MCSLAILPNMCHYRTALRWTLRVATRAPVACAGSYSHTTLSVHSPTRPRTMTGPSGRRIHELCRIRSPLEASMCSLAILPKSLLRSQLEASMCTLAIFKITFRSRPLIVLLQISNFTHYKAAMCTLAIFKFHSSRGGYV